MLMLLPQYGQPDQFLDIVCSEHGYAIRLGYDVTALTEGSSIALGICTTSVPLPLALDAPVSFV